MTLLQPPPGEIACRAWTGEWGERHVLVVAALRPHSYVPRGRGGRGFGENRAAAARYNAWRRTTREQLTVALRQAKIRPFPEGVILGVSISGGMSPAVHPGGRNRMSVWHYDPSDLHKAVEDACTGLVWHNDRQNRAALSCVWADDTADWWSVAAWGPGTDGSLRVRHAAWLGDEAVLGPTRADWLPQVHP